MVRATKIGSVIVGLAASGLAWGQSALTPLASSAEPAGKIITVSEPGKPAQKCRLIKMWTQLNGGKACQVQTVASGEIMTIVQSAPAAPGMGGKTLAMSIYHWQGSTPHPEAPMPPISMEMTPVMQTGAATMMQPAAPMPTAPVITTPASVSSVFVQPPAPMLIPTTPERAAGPMTPGGVVLVPAGSMHDGGSCTTCGDCGACGDGCSTCKPSLLERIKGCFKKDCDTTCCPDSCTTCTPQATMPAKTAAGESVVPVPTTTEAAPPAPSRPVSGLFHRHKPADSDAAAKTDTPMADAQKPDPLKDPAAYSPSKTTAELAGATAPKTDLPQLASPAAPNGKPPLGAGSVLQAGDPRYVPVPIVTMPDMRRMPQPPTAQVPQAPQPNRPYMSNAFTSGNMPAPPPVAMSEMSGNAFGAHPNAAAMAEGAFHQGMPNASGFVAPGMVPPGYAGMGQGQTLPTMPYGAAVQPGFYGPPRGQMVAPAGYQLQAYPQSQRPLMQPNYNGSVDTQSLLNQLHDSMLPSQREWAADKLAEIDWRKCPQIVDALVQSAKDDPAASVRAGCVHSLAKMSVTTPAVIAAMHSLKTDADPRVQHEASEALAKLAPGQGPAMMNDPAVQPAGAILPLPPPSN